MPAIAYTPAPNSYPAKAIFYLRSLPPGSWVSSADLSEAIGIDESPHPYLLAPMKHGLLCKRQKAGDRRLLEWSLGNGKPPIQPEDMTPDEPLETLPPSGRPVPVSAFDAARIVGRSDAEPSVEDRFKRQRADANQFRAGLFTDSTLVIEAQGQRLTLVRDQVLQLRSLLSGLGV